MQAADHPPTPSDPLPRTVWTRGKECAELARVIAGDAAIRASGDLLEACVEARAELLVTKRVPNAGPVASATPFDFSPEGANRVVALVSGGPHSLLAARMALWLGASLDLPAGLVSGYRVPDEQDHASEVIERITPHVPLLETRTVEAWTGKQLLDEIEDDVLLVFGAAGGSWIQRMFLGPGARLASGAPGGAVVVRDQAPSVFQRMEPPVYVSPLLNASDALLVSSHSAIPVVAFGRVVGVVRRAVLEAAPADVTVESVMEAPHMVAPTDSVADALEIYRRTGMDPIPVCGPDAQLVGVIAGDEMST